MLHLTIMFPSKGELLANLLIFVISVTKVEVIARSLDSEPNVWWSKVSTRYPKYDETTSLITDMVTKYPHFVNYYSVGKTVVGREMWVIHLSENIQNRRELLKPMVKQVSSMHGDEVTGRALLLMLSVDIIKRYLEKDPRIVKLLQTTDIHLMPSVNPDGFEEAKQMCSPNPKITGRRNKNKVDLNRDFPDQFLIQREDDPGFYENREPETLNMMNYIKNYPFVLSSNLHGGDLVASYPYDSVPLNVSNMRGYDDTHVPSLSPDNKVFKYLALEYSKNHKTMYTQEKSSDMNDICMEESFPEGITNGANWYNVRGGMQDFNYIHSNCFEITLELSCCKYPQDKDLIKEWENNKESLYNFMENAHMGVKGLVKADSGRAIKSAKIIIKGLTKIIRTTARGEYWRLLTPGTYYIKVSASGYQTPAYQKLEIRKGATTMLDFTLEKL